MQDATAGINRALDVSGWREDFTGPDSGVTRDNQLLPWEIGDLDERMANVMEQSGEVA